MSEENIELRYIDNEDQKNNQEIILMKLTEDILELLTTEKTPCLTLKPSYDRRETVLCTPSKTYLLRNVSQTNSLLLFQYKNDRLSLLQDSRSYLEIVPTPLFINLKPLAPIYDGYNQNIPENVPLYTLPQAKRRIPASDNEICNSFVKNLCLVMNGYLRRLSFDYAFRVLRLILAHLQAEDISLDKLTLNLIMKLIDSDEPEDVVALVLRRFSKTQTEPYALDGDAIAQWIGIHLLANTKKKNESISKEAFIRSWKSVLPEPFTKNAKLSLLQGEYILTDSSTLQYFPAEELPMDPALRFQTLFLVKPKWDLQDILPFLHDIATDNIKINTLIHKFARKQIVGQQTLVTERKH